MTSGGFDKWGCTAPYRYTHAKHCIIYTYTFHTSIAYHISPHTHIHSIQSHGCILSLTYIDFSEGYRDIHLWRRPSWNSRPPSLRIWRCTTLLDYLFLLDAVDICALLYDFWVWDVQLVVNLVFSLMISAPFLFSRCASSNAHQIHEDRATAMVPYINYPLKV